MAGLARRRDAGYRGADRGSGVSGCLWAIHAAKLSPFRKILLNGSKKPIKNRPTFSANARPACIGRFEENGMEGGGALVATTMETGMSEIGQTQGSDTIHSKYDPHVGSRYHVLGLKQTLCLG
jgi:hypothetical protein